jgi:hypothetical protein
MIDQIMLLPLPLLLLLLLLLLPLRVLLLLLFLLLLGLFLLGLLLRQDPLPFLLLFLLSALPAENTPALNSGHACPRVPPPPNLVLPSWDDMSLPPPRSTVPRVENDSVFTKTVHFVIGMLFARNDDASMKRDKARSKNEEHLVDFGKELPRIWDDIGEVDGDMLQCCKRVVVIGIHGWFPASGTSADVL